MTTFSNSITSMLTEGTARLIRQRKGTAKGPVCKARKLGDDVFVHLRRKRDVDRTRHACAHPSRLLVLDHEEILDLIRKRVRFRSQLERVERVGDVCEHDASPLCLANGKILEQDSAGSLINGTLENSFPTPPAAARCAGAPAICMYRCSSFEGCRGGNFLPTDADGARWRLRARRLGHTVVCTSVELQVGARNGLVRWQQCVCTAGAASSSLRIPPWARGAGHTTRLCSGPSGNFVNHCSRSS